MNACYKTFPSLLWAALALTACSTTADGDPAVEARIQRVISGLHDRQSLESVPAPKWMLEARYLTVAEGAVVMTNSDGGLSLADEIINSIALEYGWPYFIQEGLQ